MSSAVAPDPSRVTTPVDRGVIDLLGLLAYAELVSFFRLASDAELAPTLADKAELAAFAATEQARDLVLRRKRVEMGVVREEAMQPFIAPLDAWHAHTTPQTWLESLVKAYVGDGIAADFYRQVAEVTDPEIRELVVDVLSEEGRAEFIAAKVKQAVAEEPTLAGRLALWARRPVGAALRQAQRVALDRPQLAELLAKGDSSEERNGDLAAVSRIFARLTESHNARLQAMGLAG